MVDSGFSLSSNKSTKSRTLNYNVTINPRDFGRKAGINRVSELKISEKHKSSVRSALSMGQNYINT